MSGSVTPLTLVPSWHAQDQNLIYLTLHVFHTMHLGKIFLLPKPTNAHLAGCSDV
jgi:hypothetical protein